MDSRFHVVHYGPLRLRSGQAGNLPLVANDKWRSGVDNILSMTVHGSTTSTYYYVKDHLGTVAAVVDSGGQVVESYKYDAWGNVLGVYDSSNQQITESSIGNRYLWQGREYSWKTGLYYFRARWYDPVTGRWLSNDPIGISGGLNQYVFCRNNPVNVRDPSGLDIWVINDPSAVCGAGHIGAIVGSGNNYTYFSYGKNGFTEKLFSSLSEAMEYARQHGYTRYQRYIECEQRDENARSAARKYLGSQYNLTSHNCKDMVSDMMEAGGVKIWVDWGAGPNRTFEGNTASDEEGIIRP